jgi:5'-methylthioadenosine phosphorylase
VAELPEARLHLALHRRVRVVGARRVLGERARSKGRVRRLRSPFVCVRSAPPPRAATMGEPLLGVIGGSGLYDLPGLAAVERVHVRTPFGDPSDELVVGRLGAIRLAFLPRHGRGHRLLPSELPFRANLYALKTLGAEWVVAVSAVGSLREEIAPGHVVVPDQFIDRTRARSAESTFFGGGVVAHVQFADPFCGPLSRALATAARGEGATVHEGGVYVCMEGPHFSTRAESQLYRSWGAHVIGMTNLQEAKLAREAELCFATLAVATDYDCWRTGHDDVSIDEILRVLAANADLARRTILRIATALPARTGCGCARALEHAVITSRDAIPETVKRDLAPIAGKYL